MEKNREEKWEGGKLEMLAREYLEIRQEMWQTLANRVSEKWQTVEAKVSMPLEHNRTYRLTDQVVYGEGIEESSAGYPEERQRPT